nr:MAG TPA: SOS-response transcriptional repressor [Caudoviricetes sp.]
MKVDLDCLKAGIKASGIKQCWIAERAGTSAYCLSYMLSGRQRLTADVFMTICSLCGIAPFDVVKQI